MDRQDEGSCTFDGSMSSEGGYEDGDGGSWAECSSEKESGGAEESVDASVSEGDYGGGDERSSSFEERDGNDQEGYGMMLDAGCSSGSDRGGRRPAEGSAGEKNLPPQGRGQAMQQNERHRGLVSQH